jgi:Tol biopolymer transport system component
MAALAVAVPAQATFPGRNGQISYSDLWGSDVELNTDLWAVCPDGSRHRQLGYPDVGNAAFSPNGRWLAASLNNQYDSYGSSIWLFGVKRQERPVTRQLRRSSDHSPVWSPNGGQIAFTRTRSDRDYSVRSRAIRIYSRGHDRFLTRGWGPEWSVRGQIAFHRQDQRGTDEAGSSIYAVSAKGGAVRRLTTGWAHDWSPDGRRLLITYRVDGQTPGLAPDIAVISADGTGLRHLTSGNHPNWSPDGRRIAFVTPRGYAAVISPEGGGLHRLGRTEGGAVFSPDSRWLAIAWEEALYALHVNGGRRHFVTFAERGEDLTVLDWGVAPASPTRRTACR